MLSRLLLFFMLFTFGLYAVEGAVSVLVVEKEKYFISEEVVVKVDLRSTAFSIKNAKMGLENSDDYIILEPKSAAFLETIDINGTDWQVVHYEYKLYPLHAGKMILPSFNIHFQASMGYGQPEEDFSFKSEPISLNIKAPKGVEKNMFVLSTPKYRVQSSISTKMSEDNATQIKVGDAVTLKIVQEARNVPDILLRPIFFKESSQYKIYAEEPVLNTKEQGTDILASRMDAYTFVATKEGNISIHSQVFMWWSPNDEVLHKEVTEPYAFIVLSNPALVKKAKIADENIDKIWVYIGLVILLLIALLYKLYPNYEAWKVKKKLLHQESEEGRFEQFISSEDTQILYRNFYIWLATIHPSLSRSGFRGIVDAQASFEDSLLDLEKVLAGQEQEFDKITFINEAKKLRGMLLIEQKQSALPLTLNP